MNWNLAASVVNQLELLSEKCETDSGANRPTDQQSGGSVLKETQGSRKEIQRVRIGGGATILSVGWTCRNSDIHYVARR